VGPAALGKAYAPVLAETYADAWIAAAEAIEQGRSVAEAQQVLQKTWTDARVEAFRAQIQPAFSRVLPEGTEPADEVSRTNVAAFWRAFARGLRAGQ
jgi:hypothetical protein